VTGGEVKVEIKWGIIPFSTTLLICDLVEKIGMTCPVPRGPGSNSITQAIPDDIPGVGDSTMHVSSTASVA